MTLTIIDTDEQFFKQHTDRRARVRKARDGEFKGEFASLGPHEPNRRYVIVWKTDPVPGFSRGRVLKTPFIATADESIEDSERVARELLDGAMRQAAVSYGMVKPSMDKRSGIVLPGGASGA